MDYVVKRYDEDLQRMMIKTHINILLAGPKNAEFHGFLRRLRDKPLYIEGVDVLRRSEDPNRLDTDIVLYQSHSTHLKLFIRTFEQEENGEVIPPKWFEDDTEINAVIYLTPRYKHADFNPDSLRDAYQQFSTVFNKCAAIEEKKPIVMFLADCLDKGNNIPAGNKAANALTFVRRSLRDDVAAPTRLVLASTHTGANLDEGVLWLLENLTARESGRDYKYTPGCHSLLTRKQIEDEIANIEKGLDKCAKYIEEYMQKREELRAEYEISMTEVKKKLAQGRDTIREYQEQINEAKESNDADVLAKIEDVKAALHEELTTQKENELHIIAARQKFVQTLEKTNATIAKNKGSQDDYKQRLTSLKEQLANGTYDAEETE